MLVVPWKMTSLGGSAYGRPSAWRTFSATSSAWRAAWHHHELVAAQAAYAVLLPHARRQALRHFDQQAVADVVPLGVVERLEVIQVEDQQRAVDAAAVAGRQRVSQAVHQQAPVRQPGQGVEIREIPYLLLHLLALGDVADQVQHVGLAGEFEVRGADFDRKLRARARPVHALEGHRVLQLELRPGRAPLFRRVAIAVDVHHPQPQQVLAGIIQHAAGFVVDVMERALLVDQESGFAHVVQGEIHQRELAVGLLALGDVARDAEHADEPALRVAQGRLQGFQQCPVAVAENHPLVVAQRPPGGHGLLVALAKETGLLRVDEIEVGLADDGRLRLAEQALESPVAHLVAAVDVLEPDQIRNGVEDEIFLPLALRQIARQGLQQFVFAQHHALLRHGQNDRGERAQVDHVAHPRRQAVLAVQQQHGQAGDHDGDQRQQAQHGLAPAVPAGVLRRLDAPERQGEAQTEHARRRQPAECALAFGQARAHHPGQAGQHQRKQKDRVSGRKPQSHGGRDDQADARRDEEAGGRRRRQHDRPGRRTVRR